MKAATVTQFGALILVQRSLILIIDSMIILNVNIYYKINQNETKRERKLKLKTEHHTPKTTTIIYQFALALKLKRTSVQIYSEQKKVEWLIH